MILELNTRGVAIFKHCGQRTAAEPSQTSEARHSVAAADLEHSVGRLDGQSVDAQANRSEILVAMLGHYP
jgi:hypothetical protein